MVEVASVSEAFAAFVEEVGPRLRLALISAFGPGLGADATSEALAWGWEHWPRLSEMENQAGYLYRVGRSRVPRLRRPRLPAPPPSPEPPLVEPGLPKALERLPARRRASVLLVHGYGWTLQEAADTLGISRSTVQRHIARASGRLRDVLEVDADLPTQVRAYAGQLDASAPPLVELRPQPPILRASRPPRRRRRRWVYALAAAIGVLLMVGAAGFWLGLIG